MYVCADKMARSKISVEVYSSKEARGQLGDLTLRIHEGDLTYASIFLDRLLVAALVKAPQIGPGLDGWFYIQRGPERQPAERRDIWHGSVSDARSKLPDLLLELETNKIPGALFAPPRGYNATVALVPPDKVRRDLLAAAQRGCWRLYCRLSWLCRSRGRSTRLGDSCRLGRGNRLYQRGHEKGLHRRVVSRH